MQCKKEIERRRSRFREPAERLSQPYKQVMVVPWNEEMKVETGSAGWNQDIFRRKQ